MKIKGIPDPFLSIVGGMDFCVDIKAQANIERIRIRVPPIPVNINVEVPIPMSNIVVRVPVRGTVGPFDAIVSNEQNSPVKVDLEGMLSGVARIDPTNPKIPERCQAYRQEEG